MRFNRFTGFLIGTGLGAAAMLLLTPKSGKDTRRYLGHRVDDGREAVERGAAKFQEMRDDIRHTSAKATRQARKALRHVAKAGTLASAFL